MGNYFTFQIPSSETAWDYVNIDRSTQQSASYSALASQLITNNTYYDNEGNSTHWYRIRFYDSTNAVYSQYSNPFQVTAEYYCTPREVASFMGRDNFTDSTNPTRFEVEDIIARICDDIDEQTHTAWRKVSVSNEYYDVRVEDRYVGWSNYPYDYSTRISLPLRHRNLRTLLSGTHKIEYWNGSSWTDMVANNTSGRAGDYWMDYKRGIIYFVSTYPIRQRANVRMTYDWGATPVPGDIKHAAVLLTSIEILQKEDLTTIYPANATNIGPQDTRADRWKERAEEILKRKSEILSTRFF